MTIAVEEEWPDRFDDRLLALPDGTWLSAGERAVTRWTVDGPGRAVVRRHPWPGPLMWSDERQEVAWGPTLLTDDDPDPLDLIVAVLPELGEAARRDHVLVAGALDPTGTTAIVAVRAGPGSGRAPQTRVALLDRATGRHPVILGEDQLDPTVITWSAGPLLIGIAGAVLVVHDGGVVDPWVFATAAAPRSLAVSPDGSIGAAGLTEGSVVTWELGSAPGAGRQIHDGPVLSLAWSFDGHALATGGMEGRVQILGGPDVRHVDLGAPVVALAWMPDGRLLAKSGLGRGSIVVLRTAP